MKGIIAKESGPKPFFSFVILIFFHLSETFLFKNKMTHIDGLQLNESRNIREARVYVKSSR